MKRFIWQLFFGSIFWALSFLVALKLGAVSDASIDVVMGLRLPRALLASGVGMGLAVAGAALQALFSNPLCEPYVLGISSGAALGSVIGASLGLQWTYAGIALPAFIGALVFAAIIYFIAVWIRGGNTTVLLSGVMLGLLGSSLVALWMAFADANGIQSALFWLLGDLSRARIDGALFTFVFVSVCSFLIALHWRDLDAFLLGQSEALSLGVDVNSVRKKLIFLTSLLVGVCVGSTGMIGFVGLVVPHFVREISGALHRRLIPLCAVWGAGVLCASDTIGRSIARPYELPVGVITALFGAPVFVLILLKSHRLRQRGGNS